MMELVLSLSNSMYTVNMVTLYCTNCGDVFQKHESQVRRGERLGVSEGKYCSRDCYMAYRKLQTPKVRVKCAWCGKNKEMRKSDYEYAKRQGQTPRFCSRSCTSSYPTVGSRILSGYRYIHTPSHPNRNSNNQVAEHRLVMEAHIGRLLESDEFVHHKNFNKLDNDISNLQVVSRAEHEALHLEQKRRLQAEWWTPERRKAKGKWSKKFWTERTK